MVKNKVTVGSKQRSSASTKVAMVAPKPKDPSLIDLLEMLGNDRPYTVISHHGNTWVIHFSGDDQPKKLIYDGVKPEIS